MHTIQAKYAPPLVAENRGMSSVTIRRGDTMWAIARSKNLDLGAFQKANPGVDPRKLQIGQRLNLPGAKDSFEPAPTKAKPSTSTTKPSTTKSAGSSEAARGLEKFPYANGKIPSSALSSIGGGHKLYGNAAKSYNAMREAAKRDGVDLKVTDSYRSYEAQVAVAKKKGLYSQGGLAAKPGTSKHGLGRAVDLDVNGKNAKAYDWLKKHGAEYGFHTIPREKWHWEFRG
jgi:LAS superfamily LD-carboxypeptidase LdcB